MMTLTQAAQAHNTMSYIVGFLFYFYARVARGYPGSILVCVLTNRCWVPLVGGMIVAQRMRECPTHVGRGYIWSCGQSNLAKKFIIVKALWTELRTASKLTWNFNISSSILWRNWVGRVIFSGFICFERQAFRKSVCSLVFLLAVETHRTITCRNRVRSTWGAGKHQKIQHSNRVSRFYSQNISRIGFSSKTVAFPYKPL